MSEKGNLQPENPSGKTKPIGVDLLGQPGNDSDQLDPVDFSCRGLQTTATVRQAVSDKGGQPK
jgi:hypothetical protein